MRVQFFCKHPNTAETLDDGIVPRYKKEAWIEDVMTPLQSMPFALVYRLLTPPRRRRHSRGNPLCRFRRIRCKENRKCRSRYCFDYLSSSSIYGSRLKNLLDFKDIQFVKASARLVIVPTSEHVFVQEVLLGEVGAEEFSSDHCETCLTEGDASLGEELGRQAGFLHFVVVTSGDRATEGKHFSHGGVVTIEGQGDRVVLFNEREGETLRTNKDECHGLVPEPTETAPRGCHHVEVLRRTSRDEHPLFANRFKQILLRQTFNGCLFHDFVRKSCFST